ncbi:hypothetical protein FRB94_010391 [Tulasnella sp. JGI-2019a]|nr:hypothetical protein FRB94_010391 [Tulasnella sp. JGI-2019a]
MGGKYLYLFFRYFGTAFEIYNAWQELGDHGNKALLFTADALLSYRALCLWRMNRKLLIANCVMYAAAVVTSAVLLGFAVSDFTIVPTLEFSTGCYASTPIFTALAPIPGLLFEIWIFGMVLARLVMFAKGQRFKTSSTQTVDILQLLVHDAMWWFTFIAFLLILNAVFFAVGPHGATGFFLPFLRAFIVVMGCRLIVRMRKAYEHNQNSSSLRSQDQENGRDDIAYGDKQAAGSRTIEANRVTRILKVARRVGLPPALPTDLDAFWDDPIRTINQAVTSDDFMASALDGPSSLNGGVQQSLELHQLPLGRRSSRRTSSSWNEYDDEKQISAAVNNNNSYVERMWRTDTRESDQYDNEDAKSVELFVAPMARKPDIDRSHSAAGSRRSVGVVAMIQPQRDPPERPMTTVSASSSRNLLP